MSRWTPLDRATLHTAWARGASSGAIAELLGPGFTRNGVMGKVNRMGLMGLGDPCRRRLEDMDRVSSLMNREFCFGEPLHGEALMALRLERAGRDPDALSRATGAPRAWSARFLDRLSLVWPKGRMPLRWQGDLEGLLCFVLEMAVVAGRLEAVPVRGPQPVSPLPLAA